MLICKISINFNFDFVVPKIRLSSHKTRYNVFHWAPLCSTWALMDISIMYSLRIYEWLHHIELENRCVPPLYRTWGPIQGRIQGGCGRTPLDRKMFTFSYYKWLFSHSAPALKKVSDCTAPPQKTFWIRHWTYPYLHIIVL